MEPDVEAYEAELKRSRRTFSRDPDSEGRPLVSRRGLVALTLAASPFIASGACAAELVPAETGFVLWAVSCVVGFVVGVSAIVSLVRRTTPDRLGVLTALVGVWAPLASLVMGVANSGGYTRGRALRRLGVAHTPDSTRLSDRDASWVADHPAIDAPPDAAVGWRANGATEVASVAAFAHHANDLLALGAPPELIRAAHADALDEVRHGQLCYGLAAAIDGQRRGPAEFPAAAMAGTAPTLASVAAQTIVDGCVLEEASSRVAQRLADHPGVPAEIGAVLLEIVEDEARHAAHGWEVVHWCCARGGSQVHDAVRAALGQMRPALMAGAVDHDDWERYGLAGPTLWRECVATALESAHRRWRAGQHATESAA